jgi:hypothetical protein
MERSSKRGKIPQRDWPLIIKRYEAGETLASIARTYDCSPPAISYILSRHRARDASMENLTQLSNPVFVKESASTMSTAEAARGRTEPSGGALENREAQTTDSIHGAARTPHDEAIPATNGKTEPPVDSVNQSDDVPRATNPGDGQLRPDLLPHNGEIRRTLHLSLAQESTHRPAMPAGGEQPVLMPQSSSQRSNFPGAAQPQRAKEGTASIDRALRERVDEDIAAFLAAFDAALAQDSLESRAGLREATDRLLRAGARTRIELERLEARFPLSTREDRAHHTPAWRPR